MWKNPKPCTLLVGMLNVAITMKNSMKIIQKTKNRTIIRPSKPTLVYICKRTELRTSKKQLHVMLIVVLFTTAKIEKQPDKYSGSLMKAAM